MRLEKASYKAIKYACLKFHYAKKYPLYSHSYSVFNDIGEWCGVVLFGFVATINIGKPYGLKQGEILELQRVALNGKQFNVTQIISKAIKLIKKDVPLCKLLISYADTNQDHLGIIYQASNWFYCGESKSMPKYFNKDGRDIHSRNVNEKGRQLVFGKVKKTYSKSELIRVDQKVKHRYIYPLDKSLIPLCKSLSKPYPKPAVKAFTDDAPDLTNQEKAVVTDLTAQIV